MKAPDKIYVCIPQRLNLSTFKEDSKYVGMAYNDKGNLRSPQIEEYIRKDALMEWAEGERIKLLSETDGEDMDVGRHDMITRIIVKLKKI